MRRTLLVLAVTLLFLASTVAAGAGLHSSASEGLVISSITVDMPCERVGQNMVYDSESNRIVMFGGEVSFCVGLRDTWAYDIQNNSWKNMSPSVLPAPRLSPGMTYNSKADRVVIFGGNDEYHNYALNDTWTYDLNANTWTNMNPTSSPVKRIGAHMVYDFRLDKVIMFGGLAEQDAYTLSDTWTYDLDSNTWTQVVTATSPADISLATMVYDIESDRVVLFGGFKIAADRPDNETWVYDPNNETWNKMTPPTSPAPRFDAAGIYDSQADRFVIFGGTQDECNDTWSYNLNSNTWSEVATSSSPSSRISAMAYDARSDRSVLFGGMHWDWPNPWGEVYNDTWVLDYDNRTWTMALPDIVNPTLVITSPVGGASLTSKNVNVTGTASDNLEIEMVEVSLDNSTWVTATGTTSWFATMTLEEGKNTIYVRATDTFGNIATSTISVTVPSEEIQVWVWAVVAVGIAGAAVTFYVLTRQRKKSQI